MFLESIKGSHVRGRQLESTSDLYCGGGYEDASHLEVKSATRQAPKTTKVLFQTIQSLGEVRKKDLVEVICASKGVPFCSGHNNSLISYHTSVGGLHREVRGGGTYFTLTQKGLDYIKARSLDAKNTMSEVIF